MIQTMELDSPRSSPSSSKRELKRKTDGTRKKKSSKVSKSLSSTAWTEEEDEILKQAFSNEGADWKEVVARLLPRKTSTQCLHRWQKVLDPKLVKGSWTKEEDEQLRGLVGQYGPKNWSTIASHLNGRIGKQCRERWYNHLDPQIRKDPWLPEEDRLIYEFHSKHGNKWSELSKILTGRPSNAIKNHWNSTLKRRLHMNMSMDESDSNSSTLMYESKMSVEESSFGIEQMQGFEEYRVFTGHPEASGASSASVSPLEDSPLSNSNSQWETDTFIDNVLLTEPKQELGEAQLFGDHGFHLRGHDYVSMRHGGEVQHAPPHMTVTRHVLDLTNVVSIKMQQQHQSPSMPSFSSKHHPTQTPPQTQSSTSPTSPIFSSLYSNISMPNSFLYSQQPIQTSSSKSSQHYRVPSPFIAPNTFNFK